MQCGARCGAGEHDHAEPLAGKPVAIILPTSLQLCVRLKGPKKQRPRAWRPPCPDGVQCLSGSLKRVSCQPLASCVRQAVFTDAVGVGLSHLSCFRNAWREPGSRAVPGFVRMHCTIPLVTQPASKPPAALNEPTPQPQLSRGFTPSQANTNLRVGLMAHLSPSCTNARKRTLLRNVTAIASTKSNFQSRHTVVILSTHAQLPHPLPAQYYTPLSTGAASVPPSAPFPPGRPRTAPP